MSKMVMLMLIVCKIDCDRPAPDFLCHVKRAD